MSVTEALECLLDIALVVTLLFVMAGCVNTPPTIVQTEKLPEFHPTWPVPYDICYGTEWKIVLDENEWPVIGVPYPQNLTLKACGKDTLRYIKEITNLVCYYRPEDDPHCV